MTIGRRQFLASTLAFTEEMAFKAQDPEQSPAGGEVGFRDLLHKWFGHDSHNYKLLHWITQSGDWFRPAN